MENVMAVFVVVFVRVFIKVFVMVFVMVFVKVFVNVFVKVFEKGFEKDFSKAFTNMGNKGWKQRMETMILVVFEATIENSQKTSQSHWWKHGERVE